MSRIEELMDLSVEPEILEQMAETTCLDSKIQERIQKLALDKISSLQDQASRSLTAVTAPIGKAQEKKKRLENPKDNGKEERQYVLQHCWLPAP